MVFMNINNNVDNANRDHSFYYYLKPLIVPVVLAIGAAAVIMAPTICILAEVVTVIKEFAINFFSKTEFLNLEGEVLDHLKKKAPRYDYYHSDFVEKFKNLPGISSILIFKRLLKAESNELDLLFYLEKNFKPTADQWAEILKGAHIKLNDGGETYRHCGQEYDYTRRTSSHQSSGDQISLNGKLVHEVLMSYTIDDKNHIFTWFQLENHPVSLGYIVRHMIDYFKYTITSRNQGPWGSSISTDKHPLELFTKTGISTINQDETEAKLNRIIFKKSIIDMTDRQVKAKQQQQQQLEANKNLVNLR